MLLPLWQLHDATAPTLYYRRFMEQLFGLLAIGIVGLIPGGRRPLHLKWIAWTMLLTCAVIFIWISYLSAIDIIAYHRPITLFDNFFDKNRNEYINPHMTTGLYANTAIIFGLLLLEKEGRSLMKAQRVITVLGIFAAWLIILLSTGRIGLFGSMIVFTLIILRVVKHVHSKLFWMLSGLMLAGILVLPLTNERVNVDKMAHDPRLTIWQFSTEMIAQKPIFGYGMSSLSVVYPQAATANAKMQEDYIHPQVDNNPKLKDAGYNLLTIHPHNSFMLMELAFGAFGLMLFIALFATAAFMVQRKYRSYVAIWIVVFCLQAFFEIIGFNISVLLLAVVLYAFDCTLFFDDSLGTTTISQPTVKRS